MNKINLFPLRGAICFFISCFAISTLLLSACDEGIPPAREGTNTQWTYRPAWENQDIEAERMQYSNPELYDQLYQEWINDDQVIKAHVSDQFIADIHYENAEDLVMGTYEFNPFFIIMTDHRGEAVRASIDLLAKATPDHRAGRLAQNKFLESERICIRRDCEGPYHFEAFQHNGVSYFSVVNYFHEWGFYPPFTHTYFEIDGYVYYISMTSGLPSQNLHIIDRLLRSIDLFVKN